MRKLKHIQKLALTVFSASHSFSRSNKHVGSISFPINGKSILWPILISDDGERNIMIVQPCSTLTSRVLIWVLHNCTQLACCSENVCIFILLSLRIVIGNNVRFKRPECSRLWIHENDNTNKSEIPVVPTLYLQLLWMGLKWWCHIYFCFSVFSKCAIHYCHNLQRVSSTGNNDRMLSNNSSTLAASTTEAIHCALCANPTFCDMTHCIRTTNIQ